MSFRNFLENDGWASRFARVRVAIGLVTFGTLALELALIRWTSSQVRIFAYFNNVVLICAFLGIGLGIAMGRRRPGLVHTVLPCLLLLALPLAFSEPLGLVQMKFPDPTIDLWGAQVVGSQMLFTRNLSIFLGLLAIVVLIFVGCGAALGYLFGRIGTLNAYQADLMGSLGGVVAFTLASWMDAGPTMWFALACLPLAWLSWRWWSWVAGLAIVFLAHLSVGEAIFSPYNRIDLVRDGSGNYELQVNRDFHQYMFDLHDERLKAPQLPEVQRSSLGELRELYDLPFTINPHRASALIVGAGTGNDVQAALRNDYGRVTSVDIDGRIIALGRALHPEQPYANPKVKPVVDDARAFFEKSREEKFDVVCFGLLDSHAMSSAKSTLRLDNYVYTEDGIRAAFRRVSENGHLSLAISCFAGRWFFERLYWTVTRGTGQEPIAFYSPLHGGTVTFVVAKQTGPLLQKKMTERTVLKPEQTLEHTLTTSDDWPFLYIRPGAIPWGYLVVLGVILTGAVISVRRTFGFTRGAANFHWPLFLMGAAFLLIETRGVTSLSLLFGSTWVVNSAVFGGILLMVLVANAAVLRGKWTNPQPWFIGLFAAVVLLYFFPIGWLHALPVAARGILGGLLTGLPIAFAGVIVPMLLARATDPATALGANLLGSVLGGCLEYFSMIGGLRATALLALVLYLLAYLALGRRREVTVVAGAAAVA
jgi:hypothetical protein